MTTFDNEIQKEIVLVKQCIQGNRKSQHELYNLFAGKMYAICMRYASNVDDAQDILQDGFIKVFQKLETFRWEGSLEGWIRRVFVFTSIEFLRKKNKKTTYELDKVDAVDSELNGFDKISMKELLALIQQLPDTYRTIVNLYMVEGYTHREIGEILDIKESTSKSQLVRAKGILQKEISALKN